MNKKEILNLLISDTENGKIKWDINIEPSYFKSEYILSLTNKKRLKLKVLYFQVRVKHSKVIISMEKNIDGKWVSKTIIEMGGKKNREDIRIIESLVEKILDRR
jgi:hypothetical protein